MNMAWQNGCYKIIFFNYKATLQFIFLKFLIGHHFGYPLLNSIFYAVFIDMGATKLLRTLKICDKITDNHVKNQIWLAWKMAFFNVYHFQYLSRINNNNYNSEYKNKTLNLIKVYLKLKLCKWNTLNESI